MSKVDFGELMQKAQEMQGKMQDAQKRIAAMEKEGVSGAGLVKIRMNGQHNATNAFIDSSLLRPDADSKEMLEDLIKAAINDASKKIEDSARAIMTDIAGDIQLPPGGFGGV